MSIRLTPANARAMKPGEELYDHEVAGLQLRAREGVTSWHLRYKPRGSAVYKKPKIGTFPEMTLAKARELAKELKFRVGAGEDPLADWTASRAIPTVSELCDRYLAEYAKRRRGGAALRQHMQLIEGQIKPGLGSKRITDVTTPDVDRFIERVFNREFVPADNRGPTAHCTAGHTRRLLSQLFRVAKTFFKLPVPENPVDGSVVYKNRRRRRYASKAEMARIAEQLDILATVPGQRRPADPLAAACIWTLFFTGARVSEVRLAKHDQLIERENGEWVLFLEKHKTAAHIGAKDVMMPNIAVELLKSVGTTRGYIFSETGELKLRQLQKRWVAVRTAAGCPDLELRDARRTFASFGLSAGYSLAQVGEMLGHTDLQTTKGYSYMIQELKMAAANDIANAINSAARPSGTPEPSSSLS